MEKALYNKLKSGLGKACLVICTISLFVVAGNAVLAASFNKQINYQGKLSDELGITVVNGNYNLEFALYTSTSTLATAIWTETRTGSDRVAVTSGLFSVMLGEVAPISAIDWNQPLYLGVRVGGSGASPSWDLEMTPRKVLGTVPSAFEADKLDGLDAADFARANSATTMSTSSAGAVLTVIQTGTGPVVDFQNAGGSVFQVTNNGTASTTALTVATTAVIQGLLTVNGTGTSTFSSNLTVGGNSIFEGDILAHNITATGTLTALGLTTLGAASTTELSVTNKLTVTGQTTILGGASTTELTVANKLTVSGNSSLQNASTTNLSVSGNSYLTGNMGIGTAAPLVKLHIVGDMGADPNYGQIKIEPVSNNQGAAVYLTTTYSTTDRTWFFGAGNGSNGTTTFRIVDVTAGNKDRLNIDP
ncbi:MAG: hypothetical protein NTY66_03785, partial [Candidatus Vogelbacteria bacterium]|nr:hypothetical protein [Candidatus Vogelbacteria bacterium]